MCYLTRLKAKKAFLHFTRSLDNHDLMDITSRLHALRLPVLIIRGDAAPYLSARIALTLHQNLADSTLLRIATGSHFIQEDEPATVAQAILAFCQRHHD